MAEAFAATESDGVFAGPVRNPVNTASHLGAGSIHDDTTAKNLGFRGGTVAGSLHMEQFPPLLIKVFGDDWYQSGGMSLYFKYATTDGEPVQAFAENAPGSDRVQIWMDDPNENRICEGTASIGGSDMQSAIRQRVASVPPAEDIRILAHLNVGDVGKRAPTRISEKDLAGRLAVVTEPLPAYTEDSIFGERIVTPALQVRVMMPGQETLLIRDETTRSNFGVGLYGAIELQAISGPVFVEHDYETFAEVLAIGETPKTEYLIYESTLVEPGSDDPLFKMLMMLRFMKASSPLYQ